jgi:tetratricopeptide (TPR) repeat protein
MEALINFFLTLGDRPGALRAAADFTRRNPGRPPALLLFASTAAGDVGVVENMKTLLKPETLSHYRAWALKNSGRYAEALKLAPQIADPETRILLELECRIALGDVKTAAKLALDPASPLPKRKRIFTLLEIAESAGDAESYRAAERLAGKDADTNAELANAIGYVALNMGGDREVAERRIRLAHSCHLQNNAVLDSLAWARHLAGDRDGAWKYMDLALRRCEPIPESCEELEHAGAIRLTMGDRDGARKYYALALKLAKEGERRKFGHAGYRRHVKRISAALEKLK